MMDLVLEGVTVLRGGRPALAEVSVRFAPGRLTAVIGPNGAGKSTLLSAAAGLLAVTRGQVRLGSTPVGGVTRRELARRRAYLPQNPRVDWPISVKRAVALGLTPSLPPFGPLPADLRRRIAETIAAYELEGLRERPADALSGGELTRVMLARATISSPEILIVDEPTAGLDPKHALEAVRRLRRLADDGRTVIMAIHDLDLALQAADDVVALKRGRLTASGPAAALLTEAMLAELYEVRVRVSRDADGAAIRFFDP